MRNATLVRVLTAIVIAGGAATALAQQAKPELSAKLWMGDVGPLAPGEVRPVAIDLRVTDGWHFYHPIVLDTGLATQVKWTLPDGLEAGRLRFPAPYLGETAGIEFLAFEDEALVLTELHNPTDAPIGDAEISAKISGLACIEACIPIKATATLKLASESNPSEAGAKRVAEARDDLAPRLEDAPFLAGSRVVSSYDRLPAGGKGQLAVELSIASGHHIQHRDPGNESLVATRVFIEQPSGVLAEEQRQQWPAGDEEEIEGIGAVRQLHGKTVVRAPFELDGDLEPGERTLRVLVRYQVCSDAGQCYRPAMAIGTVKFDVVPADEPAVACADPVFKESTPEVNASTPDDSKRGATGAINFGLLLQVLGWAFLGGIILNVMPCVLPVISLKILGFVQQAEDDRKRIIAMGLVYAAGVLASFLPIAIFMAVSGAAWGGIMQSAGFLVALVAVVFGFSLSMLDVFELQLPSSALNAAGQASSGEGFSGAFMSGILTTALATPCTAPFLAPAIGALTQFPPLVQFLGVMTVGVGLALPYVILSAFPGWLKFLPKPGAWMNTFKQAVGFVMLAVVVWLLSILHSVAELPEFMTTLLLLVAVGCGAWIIGKAGLLSSWAATFRTWGAAGVLVACAWPVGMYFFTPNTSIPWQPWSPGIAPDLAAQGYTVYVDYTADWCTTCQANKKLVLETNRVATRLNDLDVYPIHADFTKQDARIQEELNAHGYNGVPLNIIYPAGKPNEPIYLPQILTTGTVLDALEQAGPSTAKPQFAVTEADAAGA